MKFNFNEVYQIESGASQKKIYRFKNKDKWPHAEQRKAAVPWPPTNPNTRVREACCCLARGHSSTNSRWPWVDYTMQDQKMNCRNGKLLIFKNFRSDVFSNAEIQCSESWVILSIALGDARWHCRCYTKLAYSLHHHHGRQEDNQEDKFLQASN